MSQPSGNLGPSGPRGCQACALRRGGIIGSVEIEDVVNKSDSPWFFGPRGLVLRDPRPCRFVPSVGALGYFRWKEADQSIVPTPAAWMLPKLPKLQMPLPLFEEPSVD